MKRSLPSLEDSMRILRSTRTRRVPLPPPPVQRSIAPLIKALNQRFEAFDTGAGRLKSRWPEIVGEAMARLCEPVKLIKASPHASKTAPARARTRQPESSMPPRLASSGGVLEIRCEGVYAPLLQHQSELILSRVNLFLGAGSVGRIRIVQGQIEAPKTAAKPATNAKPLGAEAELSLQQSLEDIADPKLKLALTRLGREVLKRNDNAPASGPEGRPRAK
jgi:hypothetical protein